MKKKKKIEVRRGCEDVEAIRMRNIQWAKKRHYKVIDYLYELGKTFDK